MNAIRCWRCNAPITTDDRYADICDECAAAVHEDKKDFDEPPVFTESEYE